MKPSMLCCAALVGLVATQGCIRFGRGSPANLQPPRGLNSGDQTDRNRPTADGLGLKLVHGKQEPATLLARDGATCGVSKKKFDSTRIGASVWCAWSDQSR